MLRGLEIIVGVYYLVFGVDGFLKKIPLPAPSEKGLRFLIAIEETRYLLFSVKVIEILVGLSWISGFGSGFAWLLFTPIWFNILAYHFFVNRKEILMPVVLLIVHLLIGYKHSNYLVSVLSLGLTGP